MRNDRAHGSRRRDHFSWLNTTHVLVAQYCSSRAITIYRDLSLEAKSAALLPNTWKGREGRNAVPKALHVHNRSLQARRSNMAVPFDQMPGVIWVDGKLISSPDAKIHVLTHGLHYASAVFEGERAY